MENEGRALRVYWIDAFTRTCFTGNPAVVVTDASGLTSDQMQRIAREVNCSETAFVLPTQNPEADLRLRWMTPTQEVDLCGHATVATFHALAQLGLFNLHPGTHQILYVETRSGVLPVTVDYMDKDAPWIWLTLPTCEFVALDPGVSEQLAAVLGLPTAGPQLRRPVEDSLNRDVLVQIESLAGLHGLNPDFNGLAELGRHQGWRGVCVYTEETLEPESWAHSRFFAPQFGITEDPVTGSVSGPLAVYLAQSQEQQGQPDRAAGVDLILEQGDCLGRSGRVRIQLQDGVPKLGGQAVTVLQGEMTL